MTLQQLKEKYDGMSYTEIRKLVVFPGYLCTPEEGQRGIYFKEAF